MSDIIDFKAALRDKQEKQLIEINRKVPGLISEYNTKRGIVVAELETIKMLIDQFEKSHLCFSNQRKVPALLINTYVNYKALSLHLEVILNNLDAQIKKYYPAYTPIH